jgi:transposase
MMGVKSRFLLSLLLQPHLCDIPIAQVARELGISDTSIPEWRKELTEHGPEAFPGNGHQPAQEEDVRRLKRELESVKQERDILNKVRGIFSRNQP